MEPAADTHRQACALSQPGPHQPELPAQNLPGAATASGYASTYPGYADQLSRVRRDITAYLHNCPAADDLILIADELAANTILHTQSPGRVLHRPLPAIVTDSPDRGRRSRRPLADPHPR